MMKELKGMRHRRPNRKFDVNSRLAGATRQA